MMTSTVKNGNDRLRKGNRPRRHLFQRITLMNVSSYIDGDTSAVVKFSAKFGRKLFSQNLVRSILLEIFLQAI